MQPPLTAADDASPTLLRLSVEAGLQAELALLSAVCRGDRPHGVLLWQPTDQALVMPRRMSRLGGFPEAARQVEATGWPVLLRETGGEPVPQSPATVNLALVYAAPSNEADRGRIETAYERLCLPLCALLEKWGGAASLGEIEGAFCDGRYNVNLNGRKLVGTAQRWRQALGGRQPVVLVHGAMLLDDQRDAMAAAVNLFNAHCGLPQVVRADSHVALHEVAPRAPWLSQLGAAYEAVLAELSGA